MNDGMKEFTKKLQEAYVLAGEDMGKQMAASIVAIVTEMTAGQGQPAYYGWPIGEAPLNLLGLVPKENMEGAQWLIMVSDEVETIPFVADNPLWKGQLTSGHRILVL